MRVPPCSYFLIQAALSWWPAVSPFDPWGATIALGFVLAVSAIKALLEDFKRHRDDWTTNARPTRIMCGDGAFRQVAWRDVCVGDIVMVRDEEEIPADLLCVYAALPERVCYVQTTNLGALRAALARTAATALLAAAKVTLTRHRCHRRRVRVPRWGDESEDPEPRSVGEHACRAPGARSAVGRHAAERLGGVRAAQRQPAHI